ncbi:ARV1, partial [Brachionus plicatilis]
MSEHLVCIECFRPVNSIFKIYSDGFKDLIECSRCHKVVDLYVECEPSVIIIDLILFKEKAYRHILFNHKFKAIVLLKFLVAFLLCDAYLYWFNKKNRQYESIRSNDHLLFYELEWNFYYMLLRAFINFLIYSCLIVFLSVFSKMRWKNVAYQVIKSLIMSSFGKLFVLPLVIWNPNDVYFNLASLFTLISNGQALSVGTQITWTKSKWIVTFSAAIVYMFDSGLEL